MTETVITTTDVAPVKVPKSFNDLNKEQLVAAAAAFGAITEGSKEAIKADLLEVGIKFEDYLKAFHPTEPVPEPEAFVMPEPVVEWEEAVGGEEEVTVVTASPTLELPVAQKYLIKFIGDNLYFERGRYSFTQAKPYGIMPAQDAQETLMAEPDKFRQAYPAELEEFYS